MAVTFILAGGFAYDSERYYINNRSTHVEVYAPDVTGKFLTLTGKAIHGTDVNERSEQLQVVLELVFIAKKWYNRRYEKRISSNKLRK